MTTDIIQIYIKSSANILLLLISTKKFSYLVKKHIFGVPKCLTVLHKIGDVLDTHYLLLIAQLFKYFLYYSEKWSAANQRYANVLFAFKKQFALQIRRM